MPVFEDITGQRFGKLTVIERAPNYVSPKGYVSTNWLCKCDCGKIIVARRCNLVNGKSTSCGCNRIEHPNRLKHGMVDTRIYKIWKGMKRRCYNRNESSYKDYGGRGITMCDEWRNDFMSFYSWSMDNGYNEDLSIDRINNDGNYEPSNCRWATVEQQ